MRGERGREWSRDGFEQMTNQVGIIIEKGGRENRELDKNKIEEKRPSIKKVERINVKMKRKDKEKKKEKKKTSTPFPSPPPRIHIWVGGISSVFIGWSLPRCQLPPPTGLVVITRMYDAAVSFRGTLGHIVGFLQHQHLVGYEDKWWRMSTKDRFSFAISRDTPQK